MLHDPRSATIVCWHPDAGAQLSMVQGSPSSQSSGVPTVQTPALTCLDAVADVAVTARCIRDALGRQRGGRRGGGGGRRRRVGRDRRAEGDRVGHRGRDILSEAVERAHLVVELIAVRRRTSVVERRCEANRTRRESGRFREGDPRGVAGLAGIRRRPARTTAACRRRAGRVAGVAVRRTGARIEGSIGLTVKRSPEVRIRAAGRVRAVATGVRSAGLGAAVQR